MLQYIDHIIVPYVQAVWEEVGNDKAALVIFDNFKGQVSASVTRLLESNNIHVCLLPPNITDVLQPMNVAVNKPAKDFIKRQFEQWYSEEVMKQLDGKDMEYLQVAAIQPIDLSMQVMKHVGATWLVEMAEFISDSPQLIVDGFVRLGITGALDGVLQDEAGDDPLDEYETDSEWDISSDESEI